MDMVAESVERDSDGPWVLPEGWAWVPLRTLSSFIGRGRGPTYVDAGGVHVVNQKCIRWHRLEPQHFKLTSREAFDRLSPELRIRAGDLLWNSTGTGTIGRALIYDGSIRELTVDSHVTIVRPSSIEPEYLGYLVETSRVQRLVVDGHVGSTNQQELPRSFVEELLVPLAPLAEQRRIVARVDALFAEIAEGEAALDAARKGLDTFRRALLKAAVTGELTKDWRETNPVTETGDDLLARIKAERAAKGQSKGRGKRTADTHRSTTAALPELPEGWAWGTLGEIADSVRNGTSAAPRAEANGNEILRISSVRPLRVDERQIRYLDDGQAAEASDATVENGDLLFTRYNGSADLVGVGAIYQGKKRFYPDKIIRVRLHEVLSDHLGLVELAVNCGAGRKHIASNIKTTAGQQGLSGESLKETPIPIPPPLEAAEILRRVAEALAASADTLSLLDAEAADAARLKQSILKSAFEGRLVPQDPADEPVSAMLARLRATPSTATPARRGRRRRP
jgi:type I restriction enzyme S subunit